MKTVTMKVTLSKTGTPCAWESGGGNTNTGNAQIICDKNGLPKQPIYIATRGQLSCGQHALIPIVVGDCIIAADHHRRDFDIKVYRITDITGDIMAAELIDHYSQGQWDSGSESDVVNAARNKATCYHCREPHYIAK